MKILKKVIIAFIIILIISIGAYLIINFNKDKINEDLSQIEEKKPEWSFETFEPTFEGIEDFNYQDYSRFMNYGNDINIYNLKITSYEEYKNLKNTIFKNMLNMTEEDFEKKFMVITAIENTSQIGLTVKNVNLEDDSMYIVLERNKNLLTEEEWKKIDDSISNLTKEIDDKLNETCIAYVFPKEMERENLVVTRDYLDSEKDYSNEVQISIGDGIGSYNGTTDKLLAFKNKRTRNMMEMIKREDSFGAISETQWLDFVSEDFTITEDMSEIDFNKWNNLGNDFYCLEITDFSEYLKYIEKYNLRTLGWKDFKEIGVVLVINKNTDKIIEVDNNFKYDELNVDVKDNEKKASLKVKIGEEKNANEKFKYSGKIIIVPNYRFLNETKLEIVI